MDIKEIFNKKEKFIHFVLSDTRDCLSCFMMNFFIPTRCPHTGETIIKERKSRDHLVASLAGIEKNVCFVVSSSDQLDDLIVVKISDCCDRRCQK